MCSDCLQMVYNGTMMMSEGDSMSMSVSSNEEQVMSNVMGLCDQCSPAAVYDAMNGSSGDYQARASLLCSSCGMKVREEAEPGGRQAEMTCVR